MMGNDIFKNQAEQRKAYLDGIINSDHRHKLIVAGPGTGKTFTFGEMFKKSHENNNLALTFIRKLVEDMGKELGDHAEVKTFHAYCKKLLHERYGRIELVPFLTKIIESDAAILGYNLSHFDKKFQILDEASQEVRFYIERGDFYDAVSFNDAVFRLYRYVRNNAFELPIFNQIVVDEFQDFNPLEVAFIEELEKKSPILIVGDDDQAVYIGRNSSPEHLRKKYHSGDYQVFQLPFCSRCPRVIVEATSAFIHSVIERGSFAERIDRPFIPFLEDKQNENTAYPKIIRATTSTIQCLSKFIAVEIQKIPETEIEEAHQKNYPCALIVGKRQYLNPLAKKLREQFSNVSFTEAQDINYSILDAYEILRNRDDSNLGWRILAEFEFSGRQMEEFIKATLDGTPMIRILPLDFIEKHEKITNILRTRQLSEDERLGLVALLGDKSDQVVKHFYAIEEEIKQEADKSQPTILLSSFEGCKGLSAGHVFIVGLNDGVMPKIGENGEMDDIECCKFIVAMTRTKKRCYLLSNRWDYNPKDQRPFPPSIFIDMIPERFLDDKGYLTSKDINP
ncbi:MAG: UvrD-helicase domain-containing protein [Bellilinea sp.]